MDLSKYALVSLSDPTWLDNYIAKMGEDAFWKYAHDIYDLLDKMKIRQTVSVIVWAKPENYDIFIKIACCYISESSYCYSFNPEYTIIKKNIDENTLAKSLALFARKRQEKNSGTDGPGTECSGERSEVIPSPEPAI